MKTITQLNPLPIIGKLLLSLAIISGALFASIKTFAQSVPEKVEVDINTGGDSVWYGQPWVWVVGIAVFIIIIIAITRNNNNRT